MLIPLLVTGRISILSEVMKNTEESNEIEDLQNNMENAFSKMEL